MCGIAGVLSNGSGEPVSFEMLSAMVAMVGHRGPDGHGLYRDDRVGLAHARLSIIDLELGAQPLTNEDRTVWLTFNGEIFNYIELRRELVAQGHRFVTNGDSEVIVHLYEQHGDDAWSRLNGQFAFALWDRSDRKLRLVRDRLGILPLHYTQVGGRVLFASEVKALLAVEGVGRSFDATAVNQAFEQWSVPAPRTMFHGVRSVRPGAVVTFDADLREQEHLYWELSFESTAGQEQLDIGAAADLLEARLCEAVSLRLRADVPVGAYLSGGLDSSVIASLVQTADRSPLETFAVRFTDPAYDETAEQRRMATVLGTDHHEIVCGPAEINAALPDVVWHCEAPLLRTAPVPLFLLSGLVRDAGRKVVLTGEGADELLAGYGIFKEDRVRRFWAREPTEEWRGALFARAHTEVQGEGARDTSLWRRFFGRGINETDHPWYSHRVRWENTSWTRRVLAADIRRAGRDTPSLGAELPARWLDWEPLARAQWLEIKTFMEPYLLACQGDRVAMAHGVEVRYPFLDPGVVDLCVSLPDHVKLLGLRDKVALRRLAARRIPSEIAARPKQPYRAPMTAPLLGEGPTEIDDLLSSDECKRSGLVDPDAAQNLLAKARRTDGRLSEREEMGLVGAATLQILHRSFVEELPGRVSERVHAFERSTLLVHEDALAGTSGSR